MPLALGLGIFSALASAQSETFHRNTVTVGGGAAVPVGNDTAYLETAPLFSVGYGYRFNRFLEADAGLQIAFGAAMNQNPEQTDLGVVQGKDHELMFPIGGRVYIPTPFKRMELSAGGGGIHLHYSETIPSNVSYGYGYSNTCYTCTARGGWGGYGLVNARYFLDDNHTFHIGTTVEFISATTNGDPVGDIPGISTTDHWTNVSVDFGLSF